MDQVQQWQNQCGVVSYVASSPCLTPCRGEHSSLTIMVTQRCFLCCVYQLSLCCQSLLPWIFISREAVSNCWVALCRPLYHRYIQLGDIFSGAEVSVMLTHTLILLILPFKAFIQIFLQLWMTDKPLPALISVTAIFGQNICQSSFPETEPLLSEEELCDFPLFMPFSPVAFTYFTLGSNTSVRNRLGAFAHQRTEMQSEASAKAPAPALSVEGRLVLSRKGRQEHSEGSEWLPSTVSISPCGDYSCRWHPHVLLPWEYRNSRAAWSTGEQLQLHSKPPFLLSHDLKQFALE